VHAQSGRVVIVFRNLYNDALGVALRDALKEFGIEAPSGFCFMERGTFLTGRFVWQTMPGTYRVYNQGEPA
jgi:hypothetical protein